MLSSKVSSALAILCLASALSACNYTHAKGPGGQSEGSAFKPLAPAEKASTMNFAYISQKILIPKCVACHGNAGGVSLETYDSVFAKQHLIHETIFVQHTMPKRGALTDEETRLLWHWLSMGCPKESPSDGSPSPPTPTTPPPTTALIPTYDSINQHIIQSKCVSCHSVGQDAERVSLLRDALLSSPLELVVPGKPDESGLVIAVERTDSKRMPLSTEGYGPLTKKEKLAIRTWILNGAKD